MIEVSTRATIISHSIAVHEAIERAIGVSSGINKPAVPKNKSHATRNV